MPSLPDADRGIHDLPKAAFSARIDGVSRTSADSNQPFVLPRGRVGQTELRSVGLVTRGDPRTLQSSAI